MNKIESMMKILFDGETPRLKYSNKLLNKNDMIKRDELYTIIAKDIISAFEHCGLVLKTTDYDKMNDKTQYKLHYTTRDPHFFKHNHYQYHVHGRYYDTVITNHIVLGKFKEEGHLDKWLKPRKYGNDVVKYTLDNKMIYDKICSILRNSYVVAQSSTRDGLHPLAVLEKRARNTVWDSMKNIRHFKPILNSCGHNQISEYDISRYNREMKDKEEAIIVDMERREEEIMMNINSEIIVDRNTIMSNINDMEELQ